MDELKENEIKRKTFEFYKNNDMKIHVELNSGRFYNGKILEVAGDMIVFKDSVLGAMPIYFFQIKILERYLERNADEEKKNG